MYLSGIFIPCIRKLEVFVGSMTQVLSTVPLGTVRISHLCLQSRTLQTGWSTLETAPFWLTLAMGMLSLELCSSPGLPSMSCNAASSSSGLTPSSVTLSMPPCHSRPCLLRPHSISYGSKQVHSCWLYGWNLLNQFVYPFYFSWWPLLGKGQNPYPLISLGQQHNCKCLWKLRAASVTENC